MKVLHSIPLCSTSQGTLFAGTFPNRRWALYLGAPRHSRVNVNVPDLPLKDNETLVRFAEYDLAFREELLNKNIAFDTRTRYDLGFHQVELWVLTEETMEKLRSAASLDDGVREQVE